MVKKFRFIAYCIGLQLISFGIVAQEKTVSPWEVGLHYHHGFLLNHSPARTDVASANLTNVWGLEATIQWFTLGQRNWHKWYNFPKWGMSILYYNIDDRIIKGQNVA